MGAATSETASEPTTDRHRTWEAGEAIDVQVGRTPTGWQAPAALGRERSIPCHTAARPVALTWAILPVGHGVEATPSLPYTPRRATHDRTGGPLRNLRADPGRGATAFLAQPSLARSTRRSYDQTLTRLVHELGGDRPLSALTGAAVTVAVTAKNAHARIKNRAKRPAARPLPLLEGPRRRRVPRESHRARREVEWASVRDCYDDPHRRSLTGGDHSSSRLAPMTLTGPDPL
jgi:hypothetical protein